MKKRTSFTRIIQLWGIFLIIGIGGGVIVEDVVVSYRDFNFRVDQMRADYIAEQKQVIKNEVERVVATIHYEQKQSEALTKRKIKSRVYEAHAVAQNIYQKYKTTKGLYEIQSIIVDILKSIRFEEGSGYYFITRLDGVAVLFPGKSVLEGHNISALQDTRGQYITKDMIEIIRRSGEGFYEYYWTKPHEDDEKFKRISFIKRFIPFNWLIGAGLYIDDIEKQIKANLLSDISRIRFGKEGYIFVNRFNGDALVSNGKLFAGTKKLWEVFDENPEKMKAIFKKEYNTALKPEGDFIYYSFIKLSDSSKESPKASFIFGIPEWRWVVGAGVYLDDVETAINLLETKLNTQIKAKVLYFTLVTAGIIALSLFLFNRLNRRLKNDLNLFISFFNRAAFSNEPFDQSSVQFDELVRMAEDANQMLAGRIQVEQALRKSEANFRGLVESSADLIWEIDKEGVYTYVSPQVEPMLGYKPDEVIGKTAFDLMPPDEAQRIRKIFKRLIKKGVSVTALENVNLHKDGRRIILETSGVPVFDDSRQVEGYRGVNRDITERKRAEEELQQMLKLKSVGTLAGGIAHDFNNILMGVFGNISLAEETLPAGHPAFERLKKAGSSMNRAIFLTKQLLTFSKGGAPLIENISLDSLITEIVCFDLSGSNVKPILEKTDDLWLAQVDKGQIQQVFSNLTINARQAMPNDGKLFISLENVTVAKNTVPHLGPGNYIRITVTDEGTGIDRKHLNRIFDPYFTTKETGSGLGLASVYSIINKHGGTIQVDSEPGKGTTFTLYLPASAAKKPPDKKRPENRRPMGKETARILIMDDEEMILSVLTQMLERNGYFVKTVEEGRRAIQVYKQALEDGNPFDVIIMDITVPGGVGGKEAIRDILKINPGARVIATSGYANDPIMADYTEYGFSGIISKPYTKNKLIEVLDRILKE